MKDLINTKLLIDVLNDNDHWEPEGIFKIQGIQSNEYHKGKEYIEVVDFPKFPAMGYQKEDIEEFGVDHIYIIQYTGVCGDDYSGYMAFPLKNGKYFVVNYQC